MLTPMGSESGCWALWPSRKGLEPRPMQPCIDNIIIPVLLNPLPSSPWIIMGMERANETRPSILAWKTSWSECWTANRRQKVSKVGSISAIFISPTNLLRKSALAKYLIVSVIRKTGNRRPPLGKSIQEIGMSNARLCRRNLSICNSHGDTRRLASALTRKKNKQPTKQSWRNLFQKTCHDKPFLIDLPWIRSKLE